MSKSKFIKHQVIEMLWMSYDSQWCENLRDHIDWDNTDAVKRCPPWSQYDYGIYIGNLLKVYWPIKEIDTTSCYWNRLQCTAKVEWNYFNVNFDAKELFEYITYPSMLERKISEALAF